MLAGAGQLLVVDQRGFSGICQRKQAVNERYPLWRAFVRERRRGGVVSSG